MQYCTGACVLHLYVVLSSPTVFCPKQQLIDNKQQIFLLHKLEYYGIRGTVNDWFKSYLENRKQLDCLGSVKSDILHISCGVSQGSVFEHILFLLYINNIHSCSEILDFHLLVDDSNIFYTYKSLSGLESSINSQLMFINTWFGLTNHHLIYINQALSFSIQSKKNQ